MDLFGIRLLAVNAENGRKLLFSIVFCLIIVILSRLAGWFSGLAFREKRRQRAEFWSRQVIRLLAAGLLLVGLVSIWFDNPARLATVMGLITAGIAIALQRVVTAVAAYFVLLRGKTFRVGDRIVMSGVRGDVIALDFIQTTIMEMGQPPGEQADAPSMWVHARQYTGRIVTVTNDKIFDQPVYNYSREFPYLWEEMQFPISYRDDQQSAEQILLDVANRHTVKVSDLSEGALREMERRYLLHRPELTPRVYWRLTDNWVELTVRFIAHEHGVRDLKDRMSRDILTALNKAKIGIASGTYEIVGIPPVRIEKSATSVT